MSPQDAAWAALSGLPCLEPGYDRTLERVLRRLTALAAAPPGTRLRVAVLGDSHVAADLWTGRLREVLRERFGDGGRGFLLFGRPWTGYWPAEAETGQTDGWRGSNALFLGVPGHEAPDRVFGLGGGALCTEGEGPEAWITLSAAGPWHGEVLFAMQPGGGLLEVRAGESEPVTLSTAAAAATLGRHPWALGGTATPALRVRALGGGRVCVLGATAERLRTGVVVDGLGLNGARLTNLAPWDPWTEPMLRGRGYHLVILSYGTNEAADPWLDLDAYARAAAASLRWVRQATPDADCLLVGPPPSGAVDGDPDAFQTRLLPLVRLQKDLSRAHGCAYFDTLAWTGGPAVFRDWLQDPAAVLDRLDGRFGLPTARALQSGGTVPALYQADRVHLTGEGYRLLGELVGDVLLRAWAAHLRGAALGALRSLLGR
jgi:lysophospholipase L1-like esterase